MTQHVDTNRRGDVDDGSEMHGRDDRLHVCKPLHKSLVHCPSTQIASARSAHMQNTSAHDANIHNRCTTDRGDLGAQGAIMSGASERARSLST